MKTTLLCTNSDRFFRFIPVCQDVTPSGATGVLLPGCRGFAAHRAVLPKPTPGLVRLFPDRERGISVASARAAAALAGLVAAAPRRLHGGSVLWSSVPQQLAPYSELVSLLGRLLGKLARGFYIVRVGLFVCVCVCACGCTVVADHQPFTTTLLGCVGCCKCSW